MSYTRTCNALLLHVSYVHVFSVLTLRLYVEDDILIQIRIPLTMPTTTALNMSETVRTKRWYRSLTLEECFMYTQSNNHERTSDVKKLLQGDGLLNP